MIVHPNIHCKSPKRIDRQGIKAVSLDVNDQRKLHVNFFNPVDDPRLTDASNYQITGGERVQVNVISAKIDDSDKRQTILSLDNVGDFSTYTLHLIQDTSSLYVDPFFSEKEFSFKIYEDSDFDCKKHETVLSSSEEDGDDNDGGDGEEGGFKEIPISIDYMAKDYESFKSALLDLIPTKAPFWTDLSEPDLGISLIELFSHIADILSYYQDRVGNEAFLGTAQNRFSIKSHLSLIDYRLQNGIAAETFLRFTTSKETLINRGTKVSSRDEEIIFETDKDILIKPEHNKMQPYDWNNNNTQLQCLLPKGSSSLLLSVDPSKTYLKSGDLLLFEQQNFNGEFIREVMRLSKDPLIVPSPYYSPVHTTLPSTTEPVFTIIGITPDSNAIGVPITIPLITATFSKPVKISTISQSTVKVRKGISANNISGIVAVAVDGKTINFKPMAPLSPNSSYNVIIEAGIQEQDGQGNTITQPKTWSFTTGTLLTLIEWYGELKNDYDISRTTIYGNIVKASNGKSVVENIKGESLMVSGSLEEPQISLSHFPLSYHLPSEVIGGKKADIVKPLSSLAVFVDNERWIEVESLLESKQFDKHYEVSVDEEGLAKITFGNGTLGMKPSMNSELLLRYRVGTGTKGNVGSNVLTRLIVPSGQSFDAATYVTNSIAAAGGVDIQDVSEAKVYGPKLITRNQPRAVTPDDYVRIVCEHPLVDKAVAKFVWTGCWFTVLVAVALRNEQSLSDKLANEIRELVEGKKLIGYAVEIREPIYANIVMAISVSVNPKFHGGDVYNAVVSKLSSKTSSSGQKGFFHHDNFTFGQPVYLSKIYEIVSSIEGVDYLDVTSFTKVGYGKREEPIKYLQQGYISVDEFEIVRLDNDPNFPEHGIISVNLIGGK